MTCIAYGDFLQTHRRDRAYLQRHLAASYETVHLLHTRMEELVRFMEDLLSVTPAQGHKQTEHMRSRLNETLELLAEVATKYSDYGTSAYCSILPVFLLLMICIQGAAKSSP